MPIAAVISDVHCGHPGAVWPDNFQDQNGNTILPNKYQKVMLEYWKDFWTEAQDADYKICLAEVIEGYTRKEHGQGLMTADLNTQLLACKALLDPYMHGAIFMNVSGSKYHGSEDTSVDEAFCKMMGGHYWNSMAMWNPKGTDKTIFFTHVPGNPMIYKSTILDRNSLFMSAIKTKLTKDPDMMLYGHLHQYFRFDTPTRINVMAPCWKFWHPIKNAAKFPYTQPTIGGLILKIPEYKGRIEVILKHYPLQHIADALVEI